MILLINCGTQNARRIAEILDDHIDVQEVDYRELSSVEMDNYSGVVISGSRILITEQDISPFLTHLSFISTTHLPVLGIGFGHQLISLLFGGFVTRTRTIQDVQLIESFEPCVLLDKLPNEFEMLTDLRETASVPSEFLLIASSDECVNEVMQHRSKPIFGVQFHPESSGNAGAIILSNFANLCLRKRTF